MENRAEKLMEDCAMIADGAKGAAVYVCVNVSKRVKDKRVWGAMDLYRNVCLHTQNNHISLEICNLRKQVVIYM